MGMTIVRHLPASKAKMQELHEELAAAGQALRDTDSDTFLLTVGSENGVLKAGCKGEVAFKSAHISEMWVSEQHRGEGVGSALLEEAEDLAKVRGCMRIDLETHSKDALRPFERTGHRVFHELKNYKNTMSLYYLEKLFR